MSQPRPSPLYIRVLVIRRGDQWLAQGLDHNLAAQGASDKQAIQSFLRILRARLRKDHEKGNEPLQGLPQAPEHFFDLWDHAEQELQTESAFGPEDATPPAYVIKQIVEDGGADLNS